MRCLNVKSLNYVRSIDAKIISYFAINVLDEENVFNGKMKILKEVYRGN